MSRLGESATLFSVGRGAATPDQMSIFAKLALRARMAIRGDAMAGEALKRGDAWGLSAMIANGFDLKAWRARLLPLPSHGAAAWLAADALANSGDVFFSTMLRFHGCVPGDFEARMETMRSQAGNEAERIQEMLDHGLRWSGSGAKALALACRKSPAARQALWDAGLMDSLRSWGLERALDFLRGESKGEGPMAARVALDPLVALAVSESMAKIEAEMLRGMPSADAEPPEVQPRRRL